MVQFRRTGGGHARDNSPPPAPVIEPNFRRNTENVAQSANLFPPGSARGRQVLPVRIGQQLCLRCRASARRKGRWKDAASAWSSMTIGYRRHPGDRGAKSAGILMPSPLSGCCRIPCCTPSQQCTGSARVPLQPPNHAFHTVHRATAELGPSRVKPKRRPSPERSRAAKPCFPEIIVWPKRPDYGFPHISRTCVIDRFGPTSNPIGHLTN